ncbi:MAG: hypothetical protein FJX00_01530 [Alphaproteobacteria bacterium]|nr:hypothetical protein [Alphaproteobacteria bacterium]
MKKNGRRTRTSTARNLMGLHTLDYWISFWSQYTPHDPNTHVVSRSATIRTMVLDHPKGYVITDRACRGHQYDVIPANTWVDHTTGKWVMDDREIGRIQVLESHKSFVKHQKVSAKMDVGYLSVPRASEKSEGLEVKRVDNAITLSDFMKEKQVRTPINKNAILDINGWRFDISKTKEAIYGVGVKANTFMTLFRQNLVDSEFGQPSYKDLACLAVEQIDDSLQFYTFDGMVIGKEKAKQVLVRELSKAIGRSIRWDDITWGGLMETSLPSTTKKRRHQQYARPYVSPHHQRIQYKNAENGIHSSIPFEWGHRNNPAPGCLYFGISCKPNPKDRLDKTGSYYVYVDYVTFKDDLKPMDRDLKIPIGERMRSFRLQQINAISADQKKMIAKPVEDAQPNGNGDILLVLSSPCQYKPDRCNHLHNTRSTPVYHTGTQCSFPNDHYSRILENGAFYAYARDQSGINWKEEVLRMACNIQDDEWIDHNGTQTHHINGWTIESCMGLKGLYGFAHDGERTISFGQIKKEGVPVNIHRVFYKAWKMFDRHFKGLHLFLKLKNNETETEMLDILNDKLFILTGQNLNQVELKYTDVQGVPFKIATVALQNQGKTTGVLKYGLSDQSKRPGTSPLIVIVGHVAGLEKIGKKHSINESMVDLLEKDLGMDFSCLVRGHGAESPMEDWPVSSVTQHKEGAWRPYTQLGLS